MSTGVGESLSCSTGLFESIIGAIIFSSLACTKTDLLTGLEVASLVVLVVLLVKIDQVDKLLVYPGEIKMGTFDTKWV